MYVSQAFHTIIVLCTLKVLNCVTRVMRTLGKKLLYFLCTVANMPCGCFSLMPLVTVAVLLSKSISFCDRTLDAVENGRLSNKRNIFLFLVMHGIQIVQSGSYPNIFVAYILYLNSLVCC